MENNKKKPIFEPVSAEEAKKIRASGDKEGRWDSGVRCESGSQDEWTACWMKSIDDPCCYWENGTERRGVCIYVADFDPPCKYPPCLWPPNTFLYAKCKV